MTLRHKTITSRQNESIKLLRSLAQRKRREEHGLFIAEGLRHALDAAEAGWRFHTLVMTEGTAAQPQAQRLLSIIKDQDCEVLNVPAALMEDLAQRENAQSVLAILHQRWNTFDDNADALSRGHWLALEEVRDPGNLGTILRTADAAGAAGVILVGTCCDPFSTESIRASMGSFAHMPLYRCDLSEFIKRCSAARLPVIGTHLKGAGDYRTAPYPDPCVIVMGTEQSGMSEAMAGACSQLVKIPMQGRADSLNLAVATALMLYEARRATLKV